MGQEDAKDSLDMVSREPAWPKNRLDMASRELTWAKKTPRIN